MKKILGPLVCAFTLLSFSNIVEAKQTTTTHATQGIASYYAEHHHGRKTASGEIFNMHAMTAAHKTLPLGSRVKVTNANNGKSVIVKINDRGPYIKGRVIDLSKGAAIQLGMIQTGTAHVSITGLPN